MIKALVLDIDDTLLGAHGLSLASKQAIDQAQAHGLQVLLATARGYRSTAPIHQELNLSTPAICHAGAMVYDFDQQSPLMTWPLDNKVACHLARLAATENVRISAYVGREVWFSQPPQKPLRPDWFIQDNLESALAQAASVLEMVVVGESATDKMLQAIQASSLTDRVALSKIREQAKTWLFIARAGTDKARALNWLLPQMGLTWSSVAACGDGASDLQMIRQARWGLAAPKANSLIKKAAHAPFVLDVQEPIADLVEQVLCRNRLSR
jgi:Cof subfamily protein (haloacid dehalogenase superfamily)